MEHFGIQVESPAELVKVTARLATAEKPLLEQAATTCCYATSDKTWSANPQGLAWKTFYTFGESAIYGDDSRDSGLTELEREVTGTCCP